MISYKLRSDQSHMIITADVLIFFPTDIHTGLASATKQDYLGISLKKKLISNSK